MKQIIALVFMLIVFQSGRTQTCNPSSATGSPNCGAAPTGYPPINDLGSGSWNSMMGGLYPNGSNYCPASHKVAGLNLASQIQPLDTAGNPAPNGKIVLLSIGLSNTNIDACEFDSIANVDICKNTRVICVNGAQGGGAAMPITSPWYNQTIYNNYWGSYTNPVGVFGALSTAGGSRPKQVQVVWLKETNPATLYSPISVWNDSLKVQMKRIMKELVTRYPNIKLCFISSRASARYSCLTCPNGSLNPEPYAYWQGWDCKQIVSDQINGDTNLTYTGPNRKSPWIGWGPYLWTDGDIARQDGLKWLCPSDFAADGTHPSLTAGRTVGGLLDCFFKNDSLCYPWFTTNGNPCPSCIPTEVKEMNPSGFIQIYPNPSSGDIYLKNESGISIDRVEIFNTLGELIFSVSPADPDDLLLSGNKRLKSGIYFLRAADHSGKILDTERLIIY